MVDGKLALIVQNDLLSGYWGGGIGIYMPNVRFAGGAAVKPVSDGSLSKMIQKTPLSGLLPNWSSTVVGADGVKSFGFTHIPVPPIARRHMANFFFQNDVHDASSCMIACTDEFVFDAR